MLQKELPLSGPEKKDYTIYGYYHKKIYEILTYVQKNRKLFYCISESMHHKEFRKVYIEDMRGIFSGIVEDSQVSNGNSRLYIEDLVHVMLISSLSIIESWLYGEIDKTPEELIELLDTMAGNMIKGSLIPYIRE
jgi:hypothetical protein